MKILCTGDLHLGAGTELGRQPGDRLADQREVLGRIGGIAVERGVDLILNAGDTFEGPGVLPEQLAVYADFVDACHKTIGIPILAITGNGKHDAAVRSTNGVEIFNHVDGITVHSRPGIWRMDYGSLHGAIATLPWTHPGRLIAQHGGDASRDELNSVVADLLLEAARGLRAQISEADGPAILLAHWSVSGSALPNGIPVDQLREPVLPLADLEELGFDAIVLGHIHAPQNFTSSITQPVFYVGSPMPLNFGEADTEHGVWILDWDGDGVGVSGIEFVPIDSRPLVTLDADITGDTRTSGLAYVDLGYAAAEYDLEGAIVRARYRATADQAGRIDNAQLRAALLDAGAHVVKIQPDIVRADRARVEGVDESLTTLDALGLYIEANAIEPELADAMRDHTTRYLEAVS